MADFTGFERAGWAHRASAYDRLVGKIAARVADDLLDDAAVAAGSRVLDLACGPGYAAARARDRGALSIGVDLSPTMVDLAREQHPDIDFRIADATDLPFDARTFDAVVAGLLLHHLADPAAALEECVRVLRPGGRVSVSVWDRPERCRFVGVLVDAITDAGDLAPVGLPVAPPFFALAEAGALVELLTTVGCTETAERTVAFEQGIGSTDELWSGLLDGTVRMSALVLSQPPEVQTRIHAAFNDRVAACRRDGHLVLPVSCRLASGRLP